MRGLFAAILAPIALAGCGDELLEPSVRCWDLDGDNACSPGEDLDGNGSCDVLDCRGAPGATGATGPAGPIGLQGPAGASGPQGPIGATGATGPQGIDGPQGPIGPQGPLGAQGPQGPIGMQGPAGTDGIACWDLDGDRSCNPLAEDVDGDFDCDVADCAGPAGPVGPPGTPGAPGADGSPDTPQQILDKLQTLPVTIVAVTAAVTGDLPGGVRDAKDLCIAAAANARACSYTDLADAVANNAYGAAALDVEAWLPRDAGTCRGMQSATGDGQTATITFAERDIVTQWRPCDESHVILCCTGFR